MHTEENIHTRLRMAREALGYTQKRVAEAVGGKLRSWQDYESGTVPGSAVIAGLVGLGINANWLLTGEGPIRTEELRNQLHPDAHADGPVDRHVLRDVLEVLEEVLQQQGRELAPAAKSELVLHLCDEIAEQEGKRPGKEKVARLLKLVV